MADAFTPEQKARMEDIRNEFHLEGSEEEGFSLTQVHSNVFRYEYRERQPGEPSHEAFSLSNPEGSQPLRFVLTAVGGPVDGIRLELDGIRRAEVPDRLKEGEALVYDGGDQATLFSREWQIVSKVPVENTRLRLGPGQHSLLLDAALTADEEAHLRLELRIWGEPELVPGH